MEGNTLCSDVHGPLPRSGFKKVLWDVCATKSDGLEDTFLAAPAGHLQTLPVAGQTEPPPGAERPASQLVPSRLPKCSPHGVILTPLHSSGHPPQFVVLPLGGAGLCITQILLHALRGKWQTRNLGA